MESLRCNRLQCYLARLSILQCYDIGHNDHGINLYGVIKTLVGNLPYVLSLGVGAVMAVPC